MKLIVLLLAINLLQINAGVYSQNSSFKVENTKLTLQDAIKAIESQTDYRIAYSATFVDQQTYVQFKKRETNVKSFLEDVANEMGIGYFLLENDVIVLTNKEDKLLKQQITIKGKIIDVEGIPLPGVNVLEKGTTNGSITDINGEYTISVSSPEAILSFSYIGFLTEEIQVGEQTTINLTMVEDIQSLEEVVVVGYGSQKKATVTGSVVNVSGDEIKKNPTPNVSNSLAGKLPGLLVSQRSGEPGRDDPNILIRGNGTFDADPDDGINPNSPLIIIDGVERSLMSRLNPEDIESISVLKDASAAIYGARAANGVILITTKKGKAGKPVFSFSYNSAFQRPTIVPKMLDAATYAEVYNEADWYRTDVDWYTKDGPDSGFSPYYSDEVIQKYRDGSDPVMYPNTDWVDEVLKQNSLQQRMNLQVTGGTESVRYLLSYSRMNQNGIYRKDPTKYEQNNIRVKIDADITKNLTVGANINAILNNSKYSPFETWINFNNILIANPTLVAQYPNGLIAPGRLQENPLLIDQRGYRKINDAPLYSTFTATYKVPFVEGLKVDVSYNYDLSNQFEKLFKTPYSFHEYNVNTQEYDKKWATNASSVELTDTYKKWTTSMFNYRIAYDRTFGNHRVAAMVGQEQQKNTYNWGQAYRKNFVSSAIDQIDVGSTDPDDKNNRGSANESAYNNYFGRLNYDFSSKYLFEFLFRYDGSQNFPDGERYGFFPGFSVGWRLSEEDFLKNNLSYLDQLKLRFSHGQVGNDRVKAFQYLQSYSFGKNYVFGSSDAAGIYANTMPNQNITWEVSKKTDFGLETSLWNHLLEMELTLWQEKRSNILATRNLSIPGTIGFSELPDENIGKVNNHGYELVIGHRNMIGKLNYSVSANVAFARSEIVFMDETPHTEAYQDLTGHPVGSELYYKADGIFNTIEELNSYPHQDGTKLGDVKILDLNNDGEINSEDQYRFDYTASPEYVFGLNVSLQYGDIDLSAFLQGQTNAYNYDGTFVNLGNSAFDNAFAERAENHWTINNPNGTMPRADTYQPGNSTFFLYDATFVRLKSLELGYSLPSNLVSKLKMDNLRIYASGYNLLTWAKEIKWSDPEISGNSLYYPQQRIINLGVNVKF